jgi:Flp pilus assembly protein TadD
LSQGDKRRATEELRIGTYFLKTSASPAGDPMDIQRFIAVNLFREKRYREAVFYANRLLRRAYNDPPLHALVAESYRCLGELAKAKNHYTRAMEGDRDSREIRYGLLSVLWQSGLPEEVLAESTRLLTRHPEDGTGRYFHGLALSRTGAPSEQVLGELQRLIKERGPDPLLMSELGAAYARSGLPELAEGWFQRTLKLHANDAETLHSLARTYEALGNREKEREAWSRYLALRPDDRKARKQLLRLLLALEAFADAAGEIERILPHEPGNVKLKELLALCFRRTARFAEALVLLRELLDGDPRREDLMKAAVYCLDRIGARKAAIKALDGYQKSNGDTLSCTLMLGVLHFQQGDLERAAETFRRAISIAPHDWRANRNLGMVYRRLGNEEFARTFLASADRYRRAGGTTGAEAEPL